jgi:hypothetical protein
LKCSAIIKEEAVSKAIYGHVLQMHSWSKDNEGLFSGTEVGIMLNKVMMTFVAATKAYKSILVSGYVSPPFIQLGGSAYMYELKILLGCLNSTKNFLS